MLVFPARRWPVLVLMLAVYLARDAIRQGTLTISANSLEGKRVLVCGASTGIGRDLAKQYALAGATVVAVARNEVALRALAEEVATAAAIGVIHPVAGDLSTKAGCRAVLDAALQHLGNTLDVVVLNHIRPFFGTFSIQTLEDIDNLMDINLRSYIYLTHMILPVFVSNTQKSTHLQLVVVSSVAGKMGTPYVAPYSAAKHGLHGFFDALRIELAKEHPEMPLTITTCIIGNIDTESAKRVTAGRINLSIHTSPVDTATAILKGAHLGLREVYYPNLETWPAIFLKSLFPALMDKLISWTVFSEAEATART